MGKKRRREVGGKWDFFIIPAQKTKGNGQTGCHEDSNFLDTKNYHQRRKKSTMEWEKILVMGENIFKL